MPKKTRILYLIDEFWSPAGGTEQNLLWLLKRVPEEEFEKHFVVFSAVRSCDPNTLPIVPRRLAEEFGFGAKSWPRRIREFSTILKELKIDVVHAFSKNGELAATLAIMFAEKIPIIGNRRDIGYHWTWKGLAISRFVQRFRLRYVANSEAAKQAAHRLEGIPLDWFTVIRNPISEERRQNGLGRPLCRHDIFGKDDLPEDVLLIGMLATVRPIKDHSTLFRAAKAVIERYPNAFFVIVGEAEPPTHRESLETLARELGIEHRIIWFGSLDNPYRILPLLDIAVLSSHSESFSNAVLEYAAAGRAIVVSDVGGLGEIVRQNETGLLVPPGNPDEWTAALLRLLDDPKLRRTLGENAKGFAFREFSEQKILAAYLDLYSDVCKRI